MVLGVSSRVSSLKDSPIRRLTPWANAAKERGIHVHHLNIGQPDIPVPASFMDGVRNAPVGVLSYTPAAGMPETIGALVHFYEELGIHLAPEDLCVTIGGSEAISFALQTVANPGDEILVPEPLYPNYIAQAIACGLRVVPITTTLDRAFHLPPISEIERRVTRRTRAILFSNPGNPTGASYSRGELAALAELALRRDVYLVADEPYREMTYDTEPVSVLALPGLERHAILLDSISKRLPACGARIGCLASRNQEVMKAAYRLCGTRVAPPTLEQYGLIAFLRDPDHQREMRSIVDTFRSRRDIMFAALQAIPGVVCSKPEGAFYMFVRFSDIADAEEFAKYLLTDFELDGETVMLAPGADFYATPGLGRNEARIAYVLNETELARAAAVLNAGLEAYTRRVSADFRP
ncbi:MAG: pyridoxal phosphate-dependent aminotransferase [Candidatus Bipolaricaulota bacterium]|nr:pyridoxal phosphate-dependent aminotransferase [Candidatus Bipolaricaulota bacterium]